MLFLFRINLDPVQKGGSFIARQPHFKPYEDEDEDKKKKREEILFMFPHNV
jgi:hypothetical protein